MPELRGLLLNLLVTPCGTTVSSQILLYSILLLIQLKGKRNKTELEEKLQHGLLMDLLPWRPLLPPENISLLTSSRTATPMLSLVITLFSMTSDPSELAMATWLNSTVCVWTRVNLHNTHTNVKNDFCSI